MQKSPHIDRITEDVRVRRTRQLLLQALFDLTIEQGFATVTVAAIAGRAMVNRSTFYRHYLDKYDLLDRYLDELQAAAAAAASPASTTAPGRSAEVPAGLLVVIRQVQQHADFFRVMLGPQGDQRFTHRFRQLTEQRYRSLFAGRDQQATPHDPPDELRFSYVAHATVGAVLWWLEQGQPFPPEQLARWIGQLNLTSAGLLANGGQASS